MGTPIETQSPASVPSTQSRTWSIAAFAAEAALEAPRASMISAPRLPTRGMNSSAIQASSSTALQAFSPRTLALTRSGYWVGEWLPQTVMLVTSETGAPSLLASWATARLWSRRIIAVNRSRGTSGALAAAISALVFAGLPTTSTLTSSAAPALIASPWGLKMPPLASSRSARSIPLVRGRAPTRRPTLQPSNASFGSSEISIARSSGKAQSSSSIAVPSAALIASGISSSRSSTGVSWPSI